MKPPYDINARKGPVELILNEDLVKEARNLTGDLSGVVESLLADFLLQERSRRLAKSKAIQETVASWNSFTEQHGSFAGEHSRSE